MLPQLLLPALLWALSGCGYQISGTGGGEGYAYRTLYRDDVKTIAVPIFANRTFYRGIEFALTKALVNQIESKSPYKVVPRERADTVLEGEVNNVRVRTISNDRISAVPQEQLYIVTVDFTWKDLRTGKVLVQRQNYEQTAPWYPTLGEGQFYGNQQNVERLALAIVQELQADWGTSPPAPPPSLPPQGPRASSRNGSTSRDGSDSRAGPEEREGPTSREWRD